MNSIVTERSYRTARTELRPFEPPACLRPWQSRPQSILHDDERATLLAGAWFGALPAALRVAILGSARVREVEPGTTLARRGDPATAWMGVVRGALRLGTSLRDGRDFTLEFVGPGQWFGDIALIDDRPLDLDVIAHVPSKLLLVSKADLQRLIADHDGLGAGLLQLNCQRLRHMFRRFEEQQTLPLSQRLAKQVQRLVHQFGRSTDDGISIALALSQTDLAAIVGGSRQRVNRTLRQMHVEGIVRLGESRLIVCDEPALEAVADGRHVLADVGPVAAV